MTNFWFRLRTPHTRLLYNKINHCPPHGAQHYRNIIRCYCFYMRYGGLNSEIPFSSRYFTKTLRLCSVHNVLSLIWPISRWCLRNTKNNIRRLIIIIIILVFVAHRHSKNSLSLSLDNLKRVFYSRPHI